MTTGIRTCQIITSDEASHCRAKWNRPVPLSKICTIALNEIATEPKLTASRMTTSRNPHKIINTGAKESRRCFLYACSGWTLRVASFIIHSTVDRIGYREYNGKLEN